MRSAVLLLAVAVAPAFAACKLGDGDAGGCRAGHPEDCDPGWTCREGACFHFTTDASAHDAPEAATDAPDGADAAAADGTDAGAPDVAETQAADGGDG